VSKRLRGHYVDARALKAFPELWHSFIVALRALGNCCLLSAACPGYRIGCRRGSERVWRPGRLFRRHDPPAGSSWDMTVTSGVNLVK
jgi:hypothetical protein